MKVLEEIAAENDIVMKLEEASTSTVGTSDVSKTKLTSEDGVDHETGEGYKFSDLVRRGKKNYKDVAEAAQAVFESATHAAEAARAVVELSQCSHGPVSPGNIGGGNSDTVTENKTSKQEQEGNDDFSEGERHSQVDVRSESKRSIADLEETIEDVAVMLLAKDVVIHDSEEETQFSVMADTTTKVKDERNLINGSNRADTRHVDNMVHSVEDPIRSEVGLKSPISVRTRRVHGY